MSPTDTHPQHVVTAVIVAHDGAAWLPRLMDALNEQTKPVQRVVAVDTGSRDRSGSVLAALVGSNAVFGMDRATGFAAAVRRAVQHKAATAPVPGSQARGHADQVEWLWLLHDDCEPAADALEQLLRGAAETPNAAVLGPKLMDWTDRNVILEAGATIDTAGRRITGIEPREVDQGQHDGDRDVLAVSSAGMLVRRDVWEQSGGFDPGMALFGEDVDFCWRVHSAGYRVRVITDAVVFHAQAGARGRRPVSVGRRARLLQRRNALVTLFGNLPFGAMVISAVGNLMLSLTRVMFYLVAKRPTAALDESAAVLAVVGHPLKLSKARRRRARGRRAAYSRLRADLPAGRSIRRVVEFLAIALSRPAPDDLAGAHHASDDPTDDDSLLVDTGFLQRMLTRPGVLLVLVLIVIAAAAERSILTAGTLGGGALLPSWEGATGLWSEFVRAYHPTGIGSASTGPPYVGFLALLATILLGKVWLAIDVLLLGCVPLAGVTAFLALHRVTSSVPVRVWAAASYALLPVAFGAISAGRLGSAVAFVLIPLIGLLAGRMFSQPPKLARRAAWATGLTLTAGTAFVPLLWPMAVVGAIAAAAGLRRSARTLIRNLGIVVLTPLVLLLAWLLPLLKHPASLLLEAGIQQPGLASASLPARSLLLLSPGGPGLPQYWVSGALLLVGAAALLASRRLPLIVSGWLVAILGLAVALLASRMTVTPAGSQPVVPWPGVPLAVAAAGLLLAAAAATDGLGRTLSAGGRSGVRRLASVRGVPVAILALAACTAPLLAASYWVMHGVSGPIGPAASQVVPPLVSSTGGSGRQLRTLVLTSAGGHVSFLLLRGESPQFADPDLTPPPAAQAALAKAVAELVAPGGGQAVNQSQQLARFDIGFVLIRTPIDSELATVLDGVPGLTGVSMTPQFDLWRLTDLPSRVSVVEPNGAVVPVASGPVSVSGAQVPPAGGTLLLAEPAGSWSASVDGHGLTPVASPAGSWAQAFKLPPGGGTLTIGRSGLLHDLVMALELLAFVVVAALALPGIRTTAEIEAASVAGESEGRADSAQSRRDGRADDARGDRVPALAGAGRGRRGADASASGDAGQYGRSRAGRADDATQVSPAGDRNEPGRAGRGRSRRGGGSRGKGRGRGRRDGDRAGRPGRDAEREAAGAGTDTRRAGRRGLALPTRSAGRLAAAAALGARDAAEAASIEAGVAAAAGGHRGADHRDESRYGDAPGYGDAAGYGDAVGYGDAAGYRGAARPDRSGGYGGPANYGVPAGSGDYDRPAGSGGPSRPSAPSPSGSFHPEPANYAGPRAYGVDNAGRRRGADYSDGPSYPERDVYGDGAGYRDSGGYRDERGNDGGASHPGTSYSVSRDRGSDYYEDQRGARGAAGSQGAPSWGSDDQSSAWPSTAPHERSRDERTGWQDEGDELESLPPSGEVHHDWSERDSRRSRGWPAPGDDGEGDTW